MSQPLQGVRVLDFTRVLSGPYCTMTLADLGADVVKVEHPERGDDTRGFGPPFTGGVSTYFLSINRGKRSLALDLKSEQGRARALELARVADVVVENFRPGVMARLGLGPERLHGENPGLIFASISGFGQANGGRPGYDLMVQGLSGIPSLTGSPEGPPNKCGASVADLVAGMNATQAILAALYRRSQTGEGAVVDVSMLDGQLSLLTYHASAHLNAGKIPHRIGNAHPSIHPFCAYHARDGWLNLCIGNDALWERFCGVIGALSWVDDARFVTNRDRVAHREALDALLRPVMADKTVEEWLEVLAEAGVPAGPIATVEEALRAAELVTHAHPDGGDDVRSVPLPFQIDEQPRAATLAAPRLGQHGEQVIEEWLAESVGSGG